MYTGFRFNCYGAYKSLVVRWKLPTKFQFRRSVDNIHYTYLYEYKISRPANYNYIHYLSSSVTGNYKKQRNIIFYRSKIVKN